MTTDPRRTADAVAKAAKYWTATPDQGRLAFAAAADIAEALAAAPQKDYAAALDVDRWYDPSRGPSSSDPAVRELALRLTEGGCRAHATAYLLGVPPRFISGMVKAARVAREAAAPAAAAA